MHKYFLTSFEATTSLQFFNLCPLSYFVPGDATVKWLIYIYNTFCKALDEGKEVLAIFCDTSKAFDRVWHKGLLFKLKSAG